MTDLMYFNGINGNTGDYLIPPQTIDSLKDIILDYDAASYEHDKDHFDVLKVQVDQTKPHLGVLGGVNAKNLAETGWGIIFAAADNLAEAIKEALSELLDHRQREATAQNEHLYREYIGEKGYKAGETAAQFLGRHKASITSPIDPNKAPYYLLIVGSPSQIPYQFQYELDTNYAVGRIYFETIEEYAQYAKSVVAAETEQVVLPRQATFFGPKNNNDPATHLSSQLLIETLAHKMGQKGHKFQKEQWTLNTILAEEATKERLTQIYGGVETPALLFTASHGMGFESGDKKQRTHQGALMCQNWGGYKTWGADPYPINGDTDYFTGDDLNSQSHLAGLIAFHFACLGAGTPDKSDFARYKSKIKPISAPEPFIARLPQRALSKGALAIIGHVDLAWEYSFAWLDENLQRLEQSEIFESFLTRMILGERVGSAMEDFSSRHASFAVWLNNELQRIDAGKILNDFQKGELARQWAANNDARNYIVLGDPAVYIPTVKTPDQPLVRPIITIAPTPPHNPPTPSETTPPIIPDLSLDTSFGIREQLTDVTQAMHHLLLETTKTVQKTLTHLTSLEVLTYTNESNSPSLYDVNSHQFTSEAHLEVVTYIKFDGDIHHSVPKQRLANGQTEVDKSLWEAHCDMVKIAQTNRLEFIKAMTEIASTILNTLK